VHHTHQQDCRAEAASNAVRQNWLICCHVFHIGSGARRGCHRNSLAWTLHALRARPQLRHNQQTCSCGASAPINTRLLHRYLCLVPCSLEATYGVPRMRSVRALLPPTPEALEDLLELFDDEGGDAASSAARTSNKRRRELLRQLMSDAADVDGEFSLSFDLRKASGFWSRALDRCAMRPTAHAFRQRLMRWLGLDVRESPPTSCSSLPNSRGVICVRALRFSRFVCAAPRLVPLPK